jgi:hypothetical protein
MFACERRLRDVHTNRYKYTQTDLYTPKVASHRERAGTRVGGERQREKRERREREEREKRERREREEREVREERGKKKGGREGRGERERRARGRERGRERDREREEETTSKREEERGREGLGWRKGGGQDLRGLRMPNCSAAAKIVCARMFMASSA